MSDRTALSNSTSHRPRLSVAIIARNAEHLLAETLESVVGLADEIVVCDTGSTDRTREVARSHRASIIDHIWRDDFAAARNAAWDAATGAWVLWLDAGERLAPEAAQSLRTFLDSQADLNRAYMLLVVVPPAPNNISGEQVGRIRLVPNRKDVRFTGRVHETIKPALDRSGLAVDGLPWRIIRSQVDNDPQVKRARAMRNLKLAETEISKNGKRPELCVLIGESMTVLGDLAGAMACFRQALQTSPMGSAIQREAYYGLLTALDAGVDNRQAQIALCVESLERFPLDAQLLCAMGGYMQAEGRIDMAARAYQTAVEYGQVDPTIWHVPDIFEIAATCLSLAHQLQNNDDEARRVLEQSLARNPSAVRMRRHLIDLHVKHDRRKEALAEFDLLPPTTPNREALRSAIRGACLASRKNWTPALAYLQTAYQAGCRDVLCLRWLSIAHLSTGNNEAAESILRTWHALEPRSNEVEQYLQSIDVAVQPAAAISEKQSADGRRLRVDAAEHPTPMPAPNVPMPGNITIYAS